MRELRAYCREDAIASCPPLLGEAISSLAIVIEEEPRCLAARAPLTSDDPDAEQFRSVVLESDAG
ncbi:MAG TPA: hypothetical protein VE644_05240 [Gaiellaceae bacterium]|nr:hypothetical protein [Gaiellaceae bacterium]